MAADAARNGIAMRETSTCHTSNDSGPPAAGIITLAGRPEGPAWVIAISGELDISCAQAVRAAFAGAPDRCDRLVIDTSAVTFLDCGGLDVLLSAAAACGRDVWLRSPSRPVRWVVELTGLAERWPATTSDEVRIS